MTELRVGEIVQIHPDTPMFGACLAVVTEVKSWGFQGYVQSAGVPGQQYIRRNHGEYERTGGMAVWVPDTGGEDD
jgi:hypothetical protein